MDHPVLPSCPGSPRHNSLIVQRVRVLSFVTIMAKHAGCAIQDKLECDLTEGMPTSDTGSTRILQMKVPASVTQLIAR
jgi:hypothetical protein